MAFGVKLSKLDILGFKSFRGRTKMRVDRGMTCLVGPNGCGKSNIVDALKWAMGEQSAKHLRGSAMGDVIFAGSEVHAAAGLAEVSITFANDDDGATALPEQVGVLASVAKQPEVTITRRLFRNGASEYRLNGVRCRLRDVQALLLGTGLGKTAPYSIIEQGRVAELVQAHPSQRRLLIEEAAGITRYRHQREQAERRMLATRDNLARLEDILSEVSANVRRLRRQAQRAARQRRYQREQQQVELALRVRQVATLEKRCSELRTQHEAAIARRENLELDANSAARDLEKAEVDAALASKEHERLTAELAEAGAELRVSAADIDRIEARLTEIDRQLGEGRLRLERAGLRSVELSTDRARVMNELAELSDADSPDLAESLVRLAETRRQQASTDRKKANEAELTLEQLRGRETAAIERREQIRQQLSDADDLTTRQASRLVERRQALDDVNTDVATWEKDADDMRRREEAMASDVQSIEARRLHMTGDLEAAIDQRDQLARRHMDLEARLQVLRSLHHSGEAFGPAVEAVLTAHRQGELDVGPVLGLLADLLTVAPEQQALTSAWLGRRLRFLVVRRHEDAVALCRYASDAGLGRVGCLVVPEERASCDEASSRIEALAAAVSPVDTTEQLASYVPSGLADGSVVRVAESEYIGGTDDGGASLLADAREIQSLVEEVERLADQLEDQDGHLDELRVQLEPLTSDLEARRSDLKELRDELVRIDARLEATRARRAEIQRDIDEREIAVENARETHTALETVLSRLDESIQRLRSEVKEAEEVARDATTAAAAAESEHETLQKQATDARVSAERILERRRSLKQRLHDIDRQIETNEATLTADEANTQQLQHERERLRADILRRRAAHAEHTEAVDVLNGAMGRCEEQLAITREQVGRASAVYRDRRAAVVKAEAAAAANERLVVRAEAERDALGSCHTEEPEETADLSHDALTARRSELERLLVDLGSVNHLAESEHAEAAERQAFLEGQRDDLLGALQNLESVIADLDETSQSLFHDTFSKVAATFAANFSRLFGGGRAQLLLSDDGRNEAGVEIVAQPPGKELQSIRLLSGGEKALSGVALVFALLELRPTPLCILDEVDAALDEANVTRFARLVADMSEQSQMLVITHNKRTMEQARRLYGVTMEEAGCSKLVTLRLDQVHDTPTDRETVH